MGKAKVKKGREHGPTAEQTIAQNTQPRRDVKVIAYEERCTSPLGVRQIKHRTDVIGGDVIAATTRSREFQEKYQKQGWSVISRAVLAST